MSKVLPRHSHSAPLAEFGVDGAWLVNSGGYENLTLAAASRCPASASSGHRAASRSNHFRRYRRLR